jgi:hypothetical protein
MTKLREWWIVRTFPGEQLFNTKPSWRSLGLGHERIHVTELLPGDIVLSRERLREAWRMTARMESRVDLYDALERELFGEGEK